MRAIDELPEYMRHCYQPLLDVFAEAEEEMVKEGKPAYGFVYAKEVRFYFHESKWCQVQYFPTLEEYMSITLVTAGYKMLSVTSFVLMGNVATKEAFDWISNEPSIERAASVINRLHDDILKLKVTAGRMLKYTLQATFTFYNSYSLTCCCVELC